VSSGIFGYSIAYEETPRADLPPRGPLAVKLCRPRPRREGCQTVAQRGGEDFRCERPRKHACRPAILTRGQDAMTQEHMSELMCERQARVGHVRAQDDLRPRNRCA
jgi:hypothetical protein